MATGTDSAPNRNVPQTPKQASFPVKPVEGFSPSELNTPLSSPADESLDVFSLNESVFSDITDDYGLDTPIKQRGTQTPPRSLSIPSLSTEYEGDVLSRYGVHGTASGDAAKDESSDILDTPADFSAAGSSAPSETTEATNASIKKENNDEGSPGFTRIWDPCLMCDHKGSIDLHDYDRSRSISFSLDVDMNFSNRRQTLRHKPRSKSDIRPTSSDVPGHLESQSTTPSNRPPIFGPEIKVTLPDSPADKTPYISSQKAQYGHVMISLASILPFSTRQFLAQNPKHCVAIKKGTNTRCSSLRNLDVRAISNALNSLPTSNMAGIRPLLEDLIPLTLCGSHRRVARKSLTAWFGDQPSNHTAEHLAEIGEWISALKRSTSGQQTSVDTSSTDSTEDTSKKTPPFPLLDPSGPSTSTSSERSAPSPIQTFQPYVVKRHAGKSVSMRLREVLTDPLTKSEINQSGLIYIFWYQGNFGYLKIGLTKDLDKRLRAWERCGKPLDVHFPLDDDDKRPVQHVYRVEKLIHAELKDHRLKEECPECNKDHIEWFRVSKDAAVNVVRKWRRWMREQPYVPRTLQDGKTVWVLDNEERVGSISDLCTPSPEPESLSTTSKKPHSTSQSRLSTPKFSDRKRRTASVSF